MAARVRVRANPNPNPNRNRNPNLGCEVAVASLRRPCFAALLAEGLATHPPLLIAGAGPEPMLADVALASSHPYPVTLPTVALTLPLGPKTLTRLSSRSRSCAAAKAPRRSTAWYASPTPCDAGGESRAQWDSRQSSELGARGMCECQSGVATGVVIVYIYAPDYLPPGYPPSAAPPP